ncbi:MAG: hypothetical protein HXX13_03285 [Bacteroidetes bacterium]|nr:hypothetical protein [Bacteroidota bacterium]
MRKLTNVLILISLLALMSCSKQGPIFEHYMKFDKGNWDRFNKVVFNVPIDKPGESYDITLVLKPDSSFMYDAMPVYVIMNTPAGEERMKDVRIKVKDGGRIVGDSEEPSLTIKTPLWKSLPFSDKGMLIISIENMIPKIQTPGVKELGIIVEHSASK